MARRYPHLLRHYVALFAALELLAVTLGAMGVIPL